MMADVGKLTAGWMVSTHHGRRTKGHLVTTAPRLTEEQIRADHALCTREFPHVEFPTLEELLESFRATVWYLCGRSLRGRAEAPNGDDEPCLRCLKLATDWPSPNPDIEET